MTAEMLKGHLDNILLAALEAAPAHGYAIIEAIRQRSGGNFDLPEGTIYPALHRLEVAGLLHSRWLVPPGGRKRRVYELTSDGVAALAARRQGWRAFAGAVDTLLGPAACPA
jgi:PadR family transcriptional regulator, regulatory protein PadR